ncbi:MAG: PAS domain-containing protein [Nitrosospira sp.]|nr:PAS domain-containing protein [Nitrosospira sp.]MBI0412606.1 PAS domain-containing protein [Nitrosospira sp.]
MMFIPEKDSGLIPQILTKVLDSCVNGVTLSDPDVEDMPLVYANKAFETVTGYSNEETVGRNCRFLQGTDRDQPEVGKLREAIKNKQEIGVTLRNYKKSGELFYNHLEMTPLFDPHGNLLYYLGVQFDITTQIRAAEEIKLLTSRLNKLENK